MKRTKITVAVGRNIRTRRTAMGLSQQRLGRYLGISFQQVQKYENGANNVACEKLVWLATLFGCSIDDLFRDSK